MLPYARRTKTCAQPAAVPAISRPQDCSGIISRHRTPTEFEGAGAAAAVAGRLSSEPGSSAAGCSAPSSPPLSSGAGTSARAASISSPPSSGAGPGSAAASLSSPSSSGSGPGAAAGAADTGAAAAAAAAALRDKRNEPSRSRHPAVDVTFLLPDDAYAALTQPVSRCAPDGVAAELLPTSALCRSTESARPSWTCGGRHRCLHHLAVSLLRSRVETHEDRRMSVRLEHGSGRQTGGQVQGQTGRAPGAAAARRWR